MVTREHERFWKRVIVVGLIMLGLGLWLCSMGFKVENGETITKNWMGPVGIVMAIIGLFLVIAPFSGT